MQRLPEQCSHVADRTWVLEFVRVKDWLRRPKSWLVRPVSRAGWRGGVMGLFGRRLLRPGVPKRPEWVRLSWLLMPELGVGARMVVPACGHRPCEAGSDPYGTEDESLPLQVSACTHSSRPCCIPKTWVLPALSQAGPLQRQICTPARQVDVACAKSPPPALTARSPGA